MPKILTDFHVHSDISLDARGTMEQIAEAAWGAGLKQIAFTDHLDLNPMDEGYGKYAPQEVYRAWKSLSDGGGKLGIALGVEIGEIHIYQHRQCLREVYQLPLDVVIGSIHYLGAYGVHANLFDVLPQRQAISSYFQQALEMVSDADMDVLGHLDYFQRYTHIRSLKCYDPQRYREVIMQILEKLVARDIALEVNSSGLRHPVNKIFPGVEVLGWYYQIGGRLISLGSDAHKAGDVGSGLDHLADVLGQIGFRRYVTYQSRRARWVELPG